MELNVLAATELRTQRTSVLRALERAGDGAPDAVHDLRRASLRALEAIRVFGPLLAPERTRAARAALSSLRGVTSTLRDHGVLEAQIDRLRRSSRGPEVRELCRLRLRSARRHERLRVRVAQVVVREARLDRLPATLDALIDPGAPLVDLGPGANPARYAVVILSRAIAEVSSDAFDPKRISSRELHVRRRALRRLRCHAECLAALELSEIRAIADISRKAEELLGAARDLGRLAKLVRERRRVASRKGRPRREARLLALGGAIASERQALLAGFAPEAIRGELDSVLQRLSRDIERPRLRSA